jgi:hypothetical protein
MIFRLGFIYGSRMMELPETFFFLFGNSWTACFRINGQDTTDQQNGMLVLLIYMSFISILGTSVFVTEVSDSFPPSKCIEELR